METLRGIFPQSQPPAKRDFLKENVMKIKSIQRMRKSKNTSEYSNKYGINPPPKLPSTRKKYAENANPVHRSSTNLSLCSSKAPITNLRKSLSTMSVSSRDFGCQTVDPEADEFFLKDSIIRYPSASTMRSSSSHQGMPSNTCSRGHMIREEPPDERSVYKSHFHDRRDEHCDKMERHISKLSEFLGKGSTSKQKKHTRKQTTPPSILKSSSSLQKLNKNSINEHQQHEDRTQRIGSAYRNARIETVEISDEDNEDQSDDEIDENKKEFESSKKERGGGDSNEIDKKRQQQLKAAAEDPDCPDNHIPLSEDERLESLKLAKKRKFLIPKKNLI